MDKLRTVIEVDSPGRRLRLRTLVKPRSVWVTLVRGVLFLAWLTRKARARRLSDVAPEARMQSHDLVAIEFHAPLVSCEWQHRWLPGRLRTYSHPEPIRIEQRDDAVRVTLPGAMPGSSGLVADLQITGLGRRGALEDFAFRVGSAAGCQHYDVESSPSRTYVLQRADERREDHYRAPQQDPMPIVVPTRRAKYGKNPSPRSDESRQFTKGQRVLHSQGLLLLLWTIAVGLERALNPIVAVLLTVIASLVVLAMMRSVRLGCITALGPMVCGLLMIIFFLPSAWNLALGAAPPGISVAEIPNFPHAGSFTFRDGVVRGDLRHEVVRAGTSNSSDGSRQRYDYRYTVAPIVPEGWERQDEIPAWALCYANYAQGGRVGHGKCMARWDEAVRAAAPPRLTASYSVSTEEVVEEAEQRLRLHSHSGARVLEWKPSPQRDQWSDVIIGGVLLVGTHLGYLFAALFGRLPDP